MIHGPPSVETLSVCIPNTDVGRPLHEGRLRSGVVIEESLDLLTHRCCMDTLANVPICWRAGHFFPKPFLFSQFQRMLTGSPLLHPEKRGVDRHGGVEPVPRLCLSVKREKASGHTDWPPVPLWLFYYVCPLLASLQSECVTLIIYCVTPGD